MTDTLKNLEGIKDEAVGKVKETYGKATDNIEVQAKGVSQQIEGEVKQQVAKGTHDSEQLDKGIEERAEQATEQIKRQISETREAVKHQAEDNLSEAITEGRRIKEEARLKADELRRDAVDKNEDLLEKNREQSQKATEIISDTELLTKRDARKAVDDVSNRESVAQYQQDLKDEELKPETKTINPNLPD